MCISGVTLKSDSVEKWLPGSFFNVKSDSPGHFSTLKADTVQILTLNFEPEVVKKWPPMKFRLPGGSFFNDFSTLKISLYTPANEVVEVYWFHNSCLSVCPSVCPSVKSGFCTITALPFDIQWWYFTYILTLTWGGPLFISGQKVKSQIWTLNFFTVSAPQLHLVLAYNKDTS